MLITTKSFEFGFKSMNKRIYNSWDETKLFTGICNNNECEIIEFLLNLPSVKEESNPLTMINI